MLDSNLFLRALRLIPQVQVEYLTATGRVQNAARQWIPSFDAPKTIAASVQAVNRSIYKSLGLDLQKKYIKIFVAADVVNISRDTSGDRFFHNGRAYQVDSENSWFEQDGWVSCLAIDIGTTSAAVL